VAYLRSIQHDDNVFVNCPFDDEYRPIFEAIVFAVHDCGFTARCALELDDSSQVRVEKICRIIAECRLGIHDISRTELDRDSNLPRFNMPLELGLFLGAKAFGNTSQRRKVALILDREPYRFQRFISDIASQDPRSHRNEVRTVVTIVRDWLRNASMPSSVIIAGGAKIAERYDKFREALPILCDPHKLNPENLIFNDLTTLTTAWMKVNPQ
jgi:hypothetical protein